MSSKAFRFSINGESNGGGCCGGTFYYRLEFEEDDYVLIGLEEGEIGRSKSPSGAITSQCIQYGMSYTEIDSDIPLEEMMIVMESIVLESIDLIVINKIELECPTYNRAIEIYSESLKA